MIANKKVVSIRMRHKIYNSIIKVAKEKDIKTTDLIRGILESFVDELDHIVVWVKEKKDLSEKIDKEFKALLVVKEESKLSKKVNENIMCIIVEKEERRIPESQTIKQIECQIRYINSHLDKAETATDDIIHLKEVKDALNNRDYDKLKSVIGYKLLRWREIIKGRIIPTKLEMKVLEDRMREKRVEYRNLKEAE